MSVLMDLEVIVHIGKVFVLNPNEVRKMNEEMRKLIQSEIGRYESYLEQPEKYCEEEDDKGFYTGVVRALKWILFLEDKHCCSKLQGEKR